MIMAALTHWVSVNDARDHLPVSPRQPGWHHFLPEEHLLGREGWCRPPQEPAPLRDHKRKPLSLTTILMYMNRWSTNTYNAFKHALIKKSDKLAGSLTPRGQKTIPKHPDSSNSYSSFIQNPGDDLMHDLMFFLCTLSVLNLLSLTTNHCWDINQKHKLKFVPKGGLPFCSRCSQDLSKHEHVQPYGLNNCEWWVGKLQQGLESIVNLNCLTILLNSKIHIAKR